MRILVTAGNTQTPIDKVRCITNVFTGRTGAQIAAAARERGHDVTLLTSHPEVLDAGPVQPVRIRSYRTFDDLEQAMADEIASGHYDAVIHAAAVSDFHVTGVFQRDGDAFVDVSAGKVKSHHAELWLRLVPTPKLVDRIRGDWDFRGKLVKFKLEVGVSDEELLAIAEKSRLHSRADLLAANTLEGMRDWAFVGAGVGGYQRVQRADLARTILEAIETR